MKRLFLLGVAILLLLSVVPLPTHAQDGGLPQLPVCPNTDIDNPICEIPPAAGTWDIDLRTERNGTIVYENEALHIVFKMEADLVLVSGDFVAPMRPLDGGTEWWGISIYYADIDDSVLNLTLLSYVNRQLDRSLSQPVSFVGENVPDFLPRTEILAGAITQETLESREISIYTPPNFELENESLPVVYMVDGQLVESFARVLEPQIEAGNAPRVVLAGVHASAPLSGTDDPARSGVFIHL